ncbi:MAG: ABC transporter substrate-binding protein [Rhizobiaceae bacterium]|nr:ABC transporter substrate-binding protein [Rhizobiaceae bacterium]
MAISRPDAFSGRSGLAAPAAVSAASVKAAHVVRVGFIPLLDAAVILAAVELGFAAREGIALLPIKDVSWSNIRDRLAFRQFDVAHMLAPMPVASQLGIGSNPYPVITPMSLGLGGNAITLSVPLFQRMQDIGGDAAEPGGEWGPGTAIAHARALRRVVDARKAEGASPLVFAVVYPFSSHNYEFRYWMGAAGIDPDADVTMTVIPPPLMADALAAGAIDGFCVNAPWNMLAVEAGAGRIVAVKADIWPSSPEKVLGMRPDWADANRETVSRLIVALDRAARWCDDPENHGQLAAIMALPHYIGTPVEIIERILGGNLVLDPTGRRRHIPNYMTFHRNGANCPWKSHALWIYGQMARWGQVAAGDAQQRIAASAFRPDLYREALDSIDTPIPLDDMKAEGAFLEPTAIAATGGALVMPPETFIDGNVFDPRDVTAYLQRFPVPARTLPAATKGE